MQQLAVKAARLRASSLAEDVFKSRMADTLTRARTMNKEQGTKSKEQGLIKLG
jgi:hypothetical protein